MKINETTMGDEEKLKLIRENLLDALDLAKEFGVVAEVVLVPTRPLKMGGYVPCVKTRMARELAEPLIRE